MLLSTLFLLALSAAGLWAVRATRRERTESVFQQAASLAVAAAAYLDQCLSSVDSTASMFVRSRGREPMTRANLDQSLAAVLRDQPCVLDAILTGPESVIIGSGLPTALEKPPGALPHLQQVLATKRRAISDLGVDPVAGKPTLFFGYPVPDAAAEVLTLALDLARVGSTFAEIPLPAGSVITLTTPGGLVLARSREADRYIGTTVEVPGRPEPGDSPRTVRLTGDGIDQLAATASIRLAPWLVTVAIPDDVVVASLWPQWRRELLVVAIAVLGSIILCVWLCGQKSPRLD